MQPPQPPPPPPPPPPPWIRHCGVFKQSDTSLDLPCHKLACTRCGVEWVTASSTACSCCSEDSSLVPTEIRPAPNAIVILLKDVLVQRVGCHRDVKAGCYEGHECTPSLTGGEDREASTAKEGHLHQHNTTANRRNS